MADRPILYTFRRCPYAIRARLALAVSETVCAVREVDLARKPAALIAASPKATVPVLVLPDGRVIEQSLDIMQWALRHNDPLGMLATIDHELIGLNDGPFKHHLDRTKYSDRYQAENALHHRTQGLGFLIRLDERLKSSAFLAGNRQSFTDIAIAPFVRQFAAIDAIWFNAQPVHRLQVWLADVLGSPLFARAMRKFSPWRPGEVEPLFPEIAR